MTHMRLIKAALVACTLALFAVRVAQAHAIHTTMTIVTTDATGITLNVRAFADDFSATIAKFAGRRTPADSSAPESDVLRYTRAQLVVRDAGGAVRELKPCGVRRANELYWLCYRVELPRGTKGTQIRNQMLTEFHSDQVNIVLVESKNGRKTLLFTKGSAPSAIDAAS